MAVADACWSEDILGDWETQSLGIWMLNDLQ
jgi:hypothetical protein